MSYLLVVARADRKNAFALRWMRFACKVLHFARASPNLGQGRQPGCIHKIRLICTYTPYIYIYILIPLCILYICIFIDPYIMYIYICPNYIYTHIYILSKYMYRHIFRYILKYMGVLLENCYMGMSRPGCPLFLMIHQLNTRKLRNCLGYACEPLRSEPPWHLASPFPLV